jgi:outer membrane autotransporter protein
VNLGDVAIGSSHLTTNGQVQLNGTSNVDKVTIASGSLNGSGSINYELLEGNGILNRSLTNLAGDAIKPGIENGNPIGQLTIAGSFTNQGDLLFDANRQAGAFVNCQLSGNHHDTLVVNGATSLGGNLTPTKLGSEFSRGESALLIQSGGPITNNGLVFDNSNYSNRNFLVIDNVPVTNTVSLLGSGVAGQNGSLANIAGLSANQTSIANVVNGRIAGNGNILNTAVDADRIALGVIGNCNTAPAAALAQLSPESYAGMTDYGIQVTKAYTTAALGMPGTSVDGTVKTVRIPMGTTQPPTPAAVRTASTSVFAGFAHFDTASDSSSDNADFDINSNGGIAGVRHEIADFTIAGFVGIDQGDISSPTLDVDADGFTIGAIASYMIQPEMNLVATGGITYGSYEYDGDRQSLLGTVDFNADSDVFDVHFGIEGDAYRAENFRLSPYMQLHYITADTAGFTESGNGSALLVRGMDEDALFAQIGVKAEYQVTSRFSVNGNVGYTHNFMDSDRQVSAALGGAAFTVNSPGLGEDFVTLGVGAQFQATDALRFGINYRAEFSNDAEAANAISIGASYSF